jgi:hypothetical protein
MTPQLLIFLGAIIYLCWALVRYIKRRNHKDTPFIEVLEDERVPASRVDKRAGKKTNKKESDSDREWRKRVRAEIEDMTK